MSDEITLREYIDLRITQEHDLQKQRWDGHGDVHHHEQQEVERTRGDLQSRLDVMNEFRSTLTDQAATFPTRDLLDQMIESTKKELRGITDGIVAAQQRDAESAKDYREKEDARYALLNEARVSQSGQAHGYGVILSTALSIASILGVIILLIKEIVR